MAWRPVPEGPSRVSALFKGVPAGSARRGFAELENRQRRKSFVGSNPTPSASWDRRWQQDAFHPSLHFKKVGSDLWSVRVGRSHRAIGRFDGDTLVWVWIGDHDDYDLLIR